MLPCFSAPSLSVSTGRRHTGGSSLDSQGVSQAPEINHITGLVNNQPAIETHQGPGA